MIIQQIKHLSWTNTKPVANYCDGSFAIDSRYLTKKVFRLTNA